MNLTRRVAAALVTCVLVAGCGSGTSIRPGDAPSFPSVVGEWSRLPPSPLSARHEAAGAYLDGRFYVVGGWSTPPCPPAASCTAPAEPPHRDGASFNPASGRWQPIAPAPTPVGGALVLTVVGTKLYVLTGDLNRDDSPVSFLCYDPDRDAWLTLPPPRLSYPQLVTAGRKIVAIDSSDEHGTARDMVFDPKAKRWERLPDDPLGPSFGRTAAWLDDRLLLTASDLVSNPGADGPSLTRLAVLDLRLNHWTTLPDSDIVGGYPVWVADRVVFPMTGSEDGGKVGNWGRSYANGAILDPATGTWTSLPESRSGRSGLEGALGNVGNRALVGGQLLQPVTREWTRVPKLPWVEKSAWGEGYRSAQTIIPGPDAVFVWGGSTEAENLAEGYYLRV